MRDATLKVFPGEILVVMGLSGSGKSTLVRCLSRLIEPTAREVLFDGQDQMKIPARELIEIRRHKRGMVFQNFALLPHRTVLQNVAFPLEVQGIDRTTRENQPERLDPSCSAGTDTKLVTSGARACWPCGGGPGTLCPSDVDSACPSAVQSAPVSVQARSSGTRIDTAPVPAGSTVTSHRSERLSTRRALVTVPPVRHDLPRVCSSSRIGRASWRARDRPFPASAAQAV